MRTMQTILTTLCCMCIAAVNYAQVLAGQAGEGFYHVTSVPSLPLVDDIGGYYNSPVAIKSLDLNGDEITDISFEVDYSESWASGGMYEPFLYPVWEIGVHFSEGYEVLSDSAHQYTGITETNTMVNIVTPINSLYDIESNPDDFQYFGDGSYLRMFRNMNNGFNIPLWIGLADKYVGLRHISETDTTFGWVRISVPEFNELIIHEYAFESEISLDTLLDLKVENDINAVQYSIGPNPFNEEIRITVDASNKIKTCSIYSMQGKLEMMVHDPVQEINTAYLSSGAYIVVLQFENGVEVRRKMVRG